MTTSPRSHSPLVIVAAAIVCWVVVLSSILRFLFGASMTGGWMIVGGFFSLMALGMIVLIREFNEAILVPVCKRAFAVNSRGFPVPVGGDDWEAASWIELQCDPSRRSELGLNRATLSANRPRLIKNKKTAEPIDFRGFFDRVIAADALAA